MNRLIRLSFVLIGMLAVLLGCLHEKPTQTESAALDQDKAVPTMPTIAATPEYLPGAHGTTERKVMGNCSLMLCDTDSMFTINTDCTHDYLRYWQSSYCAMTTVFYDFDTSNLPDASQITDTALKLYVNDTKEQETGTQPAVHGCSPTYGDNGPCFRAGVYRIEVASVGCCLTAEDTAPWICDGWTGHPNAMAECVTNGWLERTGLSNCPPSLTAITRIGLDVERISADFVQQEINYTNSKPRLKIKYKVPYNPCLDGSITVGTDCTNCTASFAVNTTSTSVTITKDDPATGPLCTYGSQMALVFDTADLVDAHDIATAKLTFYVQSQNGLNYSTKKVAVYGRTSSTACGSHTLGKDDFKGCGSLTSLGDVTITSTGATYTVTLSNPETYINQSGRTVLVLIDETTLTDPEGSTHLFVVSSKDHGTSAQWPKLEIEYN